MRAVYVMPWAIRVLALEWQQRRRVGDPPASSFLDDPNGKALSQSSDGLMVSFQGEFHAGRMLGTAPHVSYRTDQCQRFFDDYNLQLMETNGGIHSLVAGAHDPTSKIFRPVTEIENVNGKGTVSKTWPVAAFQRVVTYEDVATPTDYNETRPVDDWCMHYAVRTPQRPVKTMSGMGRNGRTFAMTAVWKCASTTLDVMLAADTAHFDHEHSSNGRDEACSGPFELEQCGKHSSFDTGGADLHFASVRNPLERFMSSIYEHHTSFGICDGSACERDLTAARELADKLLDRFPHKWHSCEHATQAYLLSGTDIWGTPISYDKILRVETFKTDVADMGRMLGQDLELRHENAKNSTGNKLAFEAIFGELKTLCTVCKVFAQDFVCFGYDVPRDCTAEQCASVGVIL